MNTVTKIASGLLAVGLTFSGAFTAYAQDKPKAGQYAGSAAAPGPFKVSELTCWDVTTIEEQEAAYAMVLLYGYLAGKSGDDVMTGDDIEKAISNTVSACEKLPDAKAADVMAGARG